MTSVQAAKTAKQYILEFYQLHQGPKPTFKVEGLTAPPLSPKYSCELECGPVDTPKGRFQGDIYRATARNKKQSEQNASELALQALREQGFLPPAAVPSSSGNPQAGASTSASAAQAAQPPQPLGAPGSNADMPNFFRDIGQNMSILQLRELHGQLGTFLKAYDTAQQTGMLPGAGPVPAAAAGVGTTAPAAGPGQPAAAAPSQPAYVPVFPTAGQNAGQNVGQNPGHSYPPGSVGAMLFSGFPPAVNPGPTPAAVSGAGNGAGASQGFNFPAQPAAVTGAFPFPSFGNNMFQQQRPS